RGFAACYLRFFLFFLVFKAENAFEIMGLYPPIVPFSGLNVPFSGLNVPFPGCFPQPSCASREAIFGEMCHLPQEAQ
ncbi:hypothetical protein, partial [Aureimonas ureilytica]|uniref:hypothetical protein n=1 Tax=Aureimonas ureilytica TaxID=401562 RepID=UPI001AECAB0C